MTRIPVQRVARGDGEDSVAIPGAGPRVLPAGEAVAYATDPKRNLSPRSLTVIGDAGKAAGAGPGPHWLLLTDWVLFAVNTTGNNTT
jgi:hypothetical protein